ncbi:general odorant-binding protein 56d [Microplitis demolitor]|uniref:general odorant-binding protein 56d n=1 Tax=Microplitis demolitor TaxID=69319 RepID=UPI00043FFF3C|nr:general odorant-binding protein 56d [Microplitis demolitor]
MKIFAVILAVCFVGALAELTEEQKAKLRELRTACVTETGVDEANVDSAKQGVWKMDDVKLRCFFFCMMKKIKVMNEDGTLNEEMTRKRMANDLPADKIDAVMMKCKDMKGADMCETAMMMMKCYAEEKAFTKIITEKSA